MGFTRKINADIIKHEKPALTEGVVSETPPETPPKYLRKDVSTTVKANESINNAKPSNNVVFLTPKRELI